MADIARLAGVSTSTVSRALNGSELVNAETRARINELARSLHYTINIGAKNLRRGENKTVAVVVPFDRNARQHLTDPFFLAMLGALADNLTERGYDMLLSRIDAEKLADAARLYHSGRAIGILLVGQWRHHTVLNDLARRGVPLVVWGARLPHQFYALVGGDNLAGGRMATAHLLDGGRRHVVFLGDQDLPEVAQRFEGYQLAHRDHGIKVDARYLVRADFTPGAGERGMVAFLKRKLRFDALFAASDLLAVSAINVMRREGIHVPHDVAVVGYDDVELASHVHPPLTTISQPLLEAANGMIDALDALLLGQVPMPRTIPARLVVRGTST
jgi:DNA-binding LacI/PurR family transcriptional regulator